MFRIFVLLTIINHVFASVVEPTDFKVELVQAIFRHGDRIMDLNERYPKDPYNTSFYEPHGYGELTNKGKRREYKIGEMLRKRYDEFLGKTYKPDEVYGYSTDQDRTKMSLQLVLAGLYSPSNDLKWNENLDWIPVAIEYRPRKFDFISIQEQCDEFGKLFDQAVASADVQRKLNEYKDFIGYLSNNTGLGMYPSIAVDLFQAVRSQLSLGLTLPSWCTDDVYKKLQEIAALRFDILTHTNKLTKLAVGPIIKKFLKNIESSELKNNKKKIYLYSAHDSNVVPFLRAHNFTTPRIVDYGTAVILEKLRGKDDRVYIRLLLWSGVGEKLSVLKLNNCDEICPLTDYLKIMDPVLPIDDGTECLYKQAHKTIGDLINGPINNTAINKRLLFYV